MRRSHRPRLQDALSRRGGGGDFRDPVIEHYRVRSGGAEPLPPPVKDQATDQAEEVPPDDGADVHDEGRK